MFQSNHSISFPFKLNFQHLTISKKKPNNPLEELGTFEKKRTIEMKRQRTSNDEQEIDLKKQKVLQKQKTKTKKNAIVQNKKNYTNQK